MRTVTLEEHYASPSFLDGPGRELKAQALRFGAPAAKLFEQLCDVGEKRIAEMDAARIEKEQCLPISAAFFAMVLVLVPVGNVVAVEPQPVANSGFDSYINGIETRLARQHQSQNSFLAGLDASENSRSRLRSGELIVEKLTPANGPNLPGAMLHHWRATAFVAGARGADFERIMKDFNSYPQHFAPQVVQAHLLSERDEGGIDRV